MGALIESTGINTDAEGSIARAIAAGKACLGAVGLEGDDVDVLINVGVYRDANMVEPAMAAHIQSGLGMSLDYARKPRAGFSFDLMNGACGVLNAVHVAGALLITGAAKRVLIVSGDGHPAKHSDHGDDFPYAGVGGAMLLAPGARPGCGFGRVSRRDGPAGDLGREGFVDLTETGPHGRDHITVRRSPGEIDALLDLATATAMECLDEAGLAGGPALLLAPRLTADFGARLAGRLKLDPGVALDLEGLGDPHTSTLTLGWHRAMQAGRVLPGAPVLLVAAGAGMTAAAAVYTPPAHG